MLSQFVLWDNGSIVDIIDMTPCMGNDSRERRDWRWMISQFPDLT